MKNLLMYSAIYLAKNLMKKYTFLMLLLAVTCRFSSAQVRIEYIAHASFVIESSAGTRLCIDPYNGEHSLGYYFPENLKVDAVAVTHPHFDHDANYYLGSDTPNFTKPGNYQVGDIYLTGIKAEHVGAQRFIQGGAVPYNTIWRVESDGLDLVHLGDNGRLSDEMLKQIGEVDVLMIQVFEDHHLYDDKEFDRVVKALKPSTIIPMHFRLTALSDIPSWTGDVDPWIDRKQGARYDGNLVNVERGNNSGEPQIIKLRHSPEVKAWGEDMKKSWDQFNTIRRKVFTGEKNFGEMNDQMSEVIERSPGTLIYYNLKAQLLDSIGKSEEVVPLLEHGLANCGPEDWEQQIIAHGILARSYERSGAQELTKAHYRWIVQQPRTYRQDVLEEARAYLKIE